MKPIFKCSLKKHKKTKKKYKLKYKKLLYQDHRRKRFFLETISELMSMCLALFLKMLGPGPRRDENSVIGLIIYMIPISRSFNHVVKDKLLQRVQFPAKWNHSYSKIFSLFCGNHGAPRAVNKSISIAMIKDVNL